MNRKWYIYFRHGRVPRIERELLDKGLRLDDNKGLRLDDKGRLVFHGTLDSFIDNYWDGCIMVYSDINVISIVQYKSFGQR